MFNLPIHILILRWYFMMLIGMIAVYTGQGWLIILTVLVAVSAVLGYSSQDPARRKAGRVIKLEGDASKTHRKAG